MADREEKLKAARARLKKFQETKQGNTPPVESLDEYLKPSSPLDKRSPSNNQTQDARSPKSPSMKQSSPVGSSASNGTYYLNLYKEAQESLHREREDRIAFEREATETIQSLTLALNDFQKERSDVETTNELKGSYIKLHDHKKELENLESMFMEKITKSENIQTDLKSKLNAALNEKGKIDLALKQALLELERFKSSKNSEHFQRINSLKNELDESEIKCKNLDKKVKELITQLSERKALNEKLQDENDQLKKINEKVTGELTFIKNDQSNAHHDMLMKQLSERKALNEKLHDENDQLKKINEKVTGQLNFIKNDQSHAHHDLLAKISKLQIKIDELQEENSRLSHDLSERVRRDQQTMTSPTSPFKPNSNINIEAERLAHTTQVQSLNQEIRYLKTLLADSEARNIKISTQHASTSVSADSEAKNINISTQPVSTSVSTSPRSPIKTASVGVNAHIDVKKIAYVSKIKESEIIAREKALNLQEQRLRDLERKLFSMSSEVRQKSTTQSQINEAVNVREKAVETVNVKEKAIEVKPVQTRTSNNPNISESYLNSYVNGTSTFKPSNSSMSVLIPTSPLENRPYLGKPAGMEDIDEEDIELRKLIQTSPLSSSSPKSPSSPSSQYYELLKVILQLSSYNRQLSDKVRSLNKGSIKKGLPDSSGDLTSLVRNLSSETQDIIKNLGIIP